MASQGRTIVTLRVRSTPPGWTQALKRAHPAVIPAKVKGGPQVAEGRTFLTCAGVAERACRWGRQIGGLSVPHARK
jgi:hypothetical protein